MVVTTSNVAMEPPPIPVAPLFTEPQDNPIPIYYPKASIEAATNNMTTDETSLPPSADSRFLVQDDGNASPEMMRMTVYQFPQTRGVWHHTGDLPLGLVCTPMAVPSSDYTPRPRRRVDGSLQDWTEFGGGVPVILDSTDRPPPRCSHCAAYINPYFGTDGICNLCGGRTRGLDLSGMPMQYGTVEYQVSGPYVTRETPVQPVHLYAIDLTCSSAPAYLSIVEQLGQDMFDHVERQTAQKWKPRIGVCLFCASGVILRNKNIVAPDNPGRYAIMSDTTQDPFSPLPMEAWTYDVSMEEGLGAWREAVGELLADFESLRQQARRKVHGKDGLELACGGVAVGFLADALRNSGGRGTMITSRRPNFGAGSIPYRDQEIVRGKVQGAYSTSTPLQFQAKLKAEEQAASEYYKKIGADCLQSCAVIDVLFHTSPAVQPPFLDLATLGEVCRRSCGQLHWVNCHEWQENMHQALSRHIQSFAVTDAVFKLRCSTGIQIKSYYIGSGNVVEGTLGSAEVELPSVSSSSTIAVELDHRVGGLPKNKKFAFLQSALLYTTRGGQRRVRVSTLAIRTTSSVSEVFKSADCAATLTLLMRESVDRLRKPTPGAPIEEREHARQKVQESVFHKCVLTLGNYREHTAAMNAPASQLVIPDRLSLLAMHCMSMMKSQMLRPASAHRMGESALPAIMPSGDDRAFFIWHAAQCHPAVAYLLVHPTIIPVTPDGNDGVGVWNSAQGPDESLGFVRMRSPQDASMASLKVDGLYFIDNGFDIRFVVQKGAADSFRQDWSSVVATHPHLASILWQFRAYCSAQRGEESDIRPTVAALKHVILQEGRHGKPEIDMLNLMTDDATGGNKNSVDFMANLHRSIRERLDAKK